MNESKISQWVNSLVKDFDWKHTLAFIVIGSALFFVVFFKEELINLSISFLEIEGLSLVIGILATALSITKQIKEGNLKLNLSGSAKNFFKVISNNLGELASPIALASSLSLSKGLVLYWKGNKDYFTGFDSWEINFLTIAVIYLILNFGSEFVGDLFWVVSTKNERQLTPNPIAKPKEEKA